VVAIARLNWVVQVDIQQMFWLIDNVISLEACLYHQVLPLSLAENVLRLGMVNLEDTAAKDYVGCIVCHMSYSLVTQSIGLNTHRAMLSAYLKYKETTQQAKQQAIPPLTVEKTSSTTELEATEPPLALPTLEVNAIHLASSVELLATLPARELLQELLGRIVTEGIGRLYFERQYPQYGRILWSLNGVVQSILEKLPAQQFQEVIDELKYSMHLAIAPVEEQTQVEIERLYQNSRILLRLQIMPGAFGEEATLQVLRGAALEFYQQQQLSHLGQDALSIAQQLQHKLREMHKRAKIHPNLSREQLEALPVLNQLLVNVNTQLEKLKEI
jgi:type II secretory ATPase GspE/PulE/Tfp pilus assembly ATPase PilB-like protein